MVVLQRSFEDAVLHLPTFHLYRASYHQAKSEAERDYLTLLDYYNMMIHQLIS